MGNPVKRDDEFEEMFTPKIHNKKIIKETKIHEYNGQYSVKLPRFILEEIGIKKGDLFIVEYDTETKEYSIKFRKKKNGKKSTSPN